MPKVSFVVPAYNAGRYLEAMAASAQAQTFSDWEMIICDDASTDDTLVVANRLAQSDPRIICIALEKNSGGPLIPRMAAARCASGEWFAPLDADDEVEPSYLAKLLERAAAEDAEAVYPTMWVDRKVQLAPVPGFDYRTLSGPETVALTLNGWTVGMGGGIIRRKLMLRIDADSFPYAGFGHVDEVFDRLVIFPAHRVAFSDACYFYRTNQGSVTHSSGPRQFHFLIADMVLVDFVRRSYPGGSPARSAAEAHLFNHVVEALKLFTQRPPESTAGRREVRRLIAEAEHYIRYSGIRGGVSRKHLLLMRIIHPLFALFG